MTSSASESFLLQLIQKGQRPQMTLGQLAMLRRRWWDVAAHRAVRHAPVGELVEAVRAVARLSEVLFRSEPGETVDWGFGPVELRGPAWAEPQSAADWFAGWSAAVAVGDPAREALAGMPWSRLDAGSEDAFWKDVLAFAAGGGQAALERALEGISGARFADALAQRVCRTELQVWLDIERGDPPRFGEALDAFRAIWAGDDRIGVHLHLVLLGPNEEARRRGLPTSADPLLPTLVIRG